MAVFTLDSVEAKEESKHLSIVNNILSHKEFGINKNILPYQDNALGLWLLDYKNAD